MSAPDKSAPRKIEENAACSEGGKKETAHSISRKTKVSTHQVTKSERTPPHL